MAKYTSGIVEKYSRETYRFVWEEQLREGEVWCKTGFEGSFFSLFFQMASYTFLEVQLFSMLTHWNELFSLWKGFYVWSQPDDHSNTFPAFFLLNVGAKWPVWKGRSCRSHGWSRWGRGKQSQRGRVRKSLVLLGLNVVAKSLFVFFF